MRYFMDIDNERGKIWCDVDVYIYVAFMCIIHVSLNKDYYLEVIHQLFGDG